MPGLGALMGQLQYKNSNVEHFYKRNHKLMHQAPSLKDGIRVWVRVRIRIRLAL